MYVNIIDVGIVLLILGFIIIGWKNGFIKMTVSSVGVIVVFIISYLFKNPIAEWLSLNLPFFHFFGFFKDVVILNVIVYQLLAFIIVFSALILVYSLVLRLSGLIEKILRATIILGIPSKVLGGVLGFVEGLFICCIILMILSLPVLNLPFMKESKLANEILTYVPVVTASTNNTNNAVKEIIVLKDKFNGSKDEFNEECLDILLKYKVIDYEYAYKLYKKGKLDFKGSKKIIEKYKKINK